MIHPTAIISDETVLGTNVTVGPYTVLEGKNIVGDNVKIMSHVWMSDSEIGEETMLTPFAKIEKSVLGKQCKIGCELRKCVFGDRVQGSHTNIVLEGVTIAGHTNIASGTVFGIWGGAYDDNGGYIKAKMHIGSNVFVGINTSFYPGRDQSITIGSNVYIAGDLCIRDDVPDGHTVYPRSLVQHLQTKGISFDILKTTESYCILNRNKMKEDGIMKHW